MKTSFQAKSSVSPSTMHMLFNHPDNFQQGIPVSFQKTQTHFFYICWKTTDKCTNFM
jgi:hypothetical protein